MCIAACLNDAAVVWGLLLASHCHCFQVPVSARRLSPCAKTFAKPFGSAAISRTMVRKKIDEVVSRSA